MAEFLLAAPLLLMLGLGGLETARWLHVRQAVNLALLQAARAGITQHARPEAIALAFEQALLPLYAATSRQAAAQRLADSLHARAWQMRAAPWQIEILSPSPAAYLRHADMRLPVRDAGALARIDNDYQLEQRQRSAGPPASSVQSPDPFTRPDIYQANTLHLRLTYPYAPLVPGIGALLTTLSDHAAGYARAAWRNGYLPMRQEIRLGMTSHPVDWPALPDGRVIKAQAAGLGDLPADAHWPAVAAAACRGIWCTPNGIPSLSAPDRVDAKTAADGLPLAWPLSPVWLPEDAPPAWRGNDQEGLLCSAP